MTKKVLVAYLISIVLILTPLGAFANNLNLTYDGAVHKYTGNIYTLKVNDELVDSDIPPIIMDDRSLVPVRAIFESLGANVYWDGNEKKVLVSYRGMDVELTIDSYVASVNDKKIEMEVPAKIINDRTMVPLRFVGEQLNMDVGFDGEKGEISINSYDLGNLANLKSIKHAKNNNQDSVTISLDKNRDYRIQRDSDPEKIVVDFPNTKISSIESTIKPNSDLIDSISSEQFDIGTARVVLDLKDNLQYSILENENCVILNISPYENLDSKNKFDIIYTNKSDYELVQIPIEHYTGYEDFVLENNDRIVIDIPNIVIDGNFVKKEIKGVLVESIRCGEPEENVGRIVIDTVAKPYYRIIEDDGQLVVYISDTPITGELDIEIPLATRGEGDRENEEMKNLLKVNYFDRGNFEEIKFNIREYKNYSVFKELENNRIIVEIPDARGPIVEQIIDVKSDLIEDISYASYNNIVARAFINFSGDYSCMISEEIDGFILKITEVDDMDIGKNEEEDGDIEEGKDVEGNENEGIEEGKDGEEGKDEELIWDFDEEDDSYLANKMGIVYEKDQEFTKVMMGFAKGYEDYKISRLSNPERIVIDIPNACTEKDQQTININSNYINNIRYAQFEERIARVVIEVPAGTQYYTEELNTRLDVYVTKAMDTKNITYFGNMDRVHFILQGARLTEGGSDLKKLYTGKYDLDSKRYTITFPSHLANINTGTMHIGDSIIDNIKITKDTSKNQTSMEFNTKEKYHFEIIYRGDVNNTAINLLKPVSKKDRLVVIDAGHGGVEPGAVHGGIEEKNLNIDIALRLNKLLKENGVKTFMIREDDRFVGLYERAYIANSLNATLFLSIHNNAFYSVHKGTETLYYPPRSGSTGFNGRRFAEIIQNQVVSTLNTNNRKIVERPNLVVLKATTMPAALAEIAFMSNAEDMSRLKTPEFRQKAADALCKSILQALEEID